MINITKLYQKPRIFQTLSGLEPVKFQELLEKIEPLYVKSEQKRKYKKNRERCEGGGRKLCLSLEQSLFLLLLYYRTYVNHVFIGMLANMNDSNVCRYFKRIEPLLAQTFRIPERKIAITEKEVLNLIIDATEQETQKRDGSGYSGKKKKNTIKTQIVINSNGKIKSVSKSIKGNIHDKKLYDKSRIITDSKIKIKGDLGYVGTKCLTPFKKPRNGKLTAIEKAYNKWFNKKRVMIEHVFASLKKFRILDYKFRNNINRYNMIFKNIAGIRNFIIA